MAFVLTPVFGLAVCVVAHVLFSRALRELSRPNAILCSFGLGLVSVLGLAVVFAAQRSGAVSADEFIGQGVLWIVAYTCLVYCYVFGFFNLGESARRIRLLIELHSAGEKGMTFDEILAVYNARMIIDARLGRLLAGGQIIEKDGRYFVGSPLMLYLAKALVLLKVVLLGARSELGCRASNQHNA